jgi:hypothetical protein
MNGGIIQPITHINPPISDCHQNWNAAMAFKKEKESVGEKVVGGEKIGTQINIIYLILDQAAERILLAI